MTRDPARVRPSRGVDVVRADFDDPASLRRATAGTEAVFLLTAPATPTPRHDLALLDAARAAGTTRVVKVSAIGTGETGEGNQAVGAWHLLAERAVQASGMAWTLLRPSVFASNTLHWADAIRAGDPVPNLTGRGRQGVVDPRDVAAVAAEALTSPSHHTGQTYTLTGPACSASRSRPPASRTCSGGPSGPSTYPWTRPAARCSHPEWPAPPWTPPSPASPGHGRGTTPS
jgi:uncharacterized protein YbjT (DUF2867 family)